MWRRTEVEVRKVQYKCRVDGRLTWEHYQEAGKEEFIGWEKKVRVDEVMEGI